MAKRAPTADEALDRLIAGNARFVRGEAKFETIQTDHLADLATGQRPFATILGCSDSRVAPELIFDAGLGELFIIRVAGNVVSPEIMGSLQYAAVKIRTPLFVVLGHEHCGAVEAALDAKLRGARYRSRIERLLAGIMPGLKGIDPALPHDEQLQRGVESNVRWSLEQIRATPEAQAKAATGEFMLVGAVYEIESGVVRFLP
jgi:carbonic anhydrase